MRKLTFGLVLALMLALAAMFTGCEPNVPEDDNEGDNAEVTLMPRANDNSDAGRASDNARDGTDMFEDDGRDGDGDGGNLDDEDGENGVGGDNDEEAAAEGDTPAADFGGTNYDDFIATLSYNPVTVSKLSAGGADFSHLSDAKIGWGLGATVDDNNRPTDAVKANQDYGALGAVFLGESEPPAVYLTFDEGYENGYTAAILDELKRRNAVATFFVTYDYCKTAPDLVQRMIDEGHALGNHSYSHPSFPDCSEARIREEIGNLHEYVKENFDYEMRLVRFPMGEFSEKSLAMAQSMGYTSVFWSFAYMDWNVNSQPDPAASLEKIKDATHPGGIYLLHAVSSVNAQILGEVLDYWRGEGYRMGVIGEENENGAVRENSPAFFKRNSQNRTIPREIQTQ